MSARRIVVATGALALCLPVLTAAQGLGDVAAKEREKRAKEAAEKKGPQTRVITDEDLSKGRPAGSTSGEGAAAAGASTAAPSGDSAPVNSSPQPEPAPDPQAAIRPQMDNLRQAQAQLQEVEARVRELSDKLNPMSGTFIYGGTGSNKPSEEAEVRQQLQEAEAQLRDARAAVASASQAVDDARPGRLGASPPPQ